MTSAVSASSDPYHPCEEQDVRPGCSAREGGRGVRMKPRNRDTGVRGSVASAPWEQHAHAHDSRPQGNRAWGFALNDGPPKRSRMS